MHQLVLHREIIRVMNGIGTLIVGQKKQVQVTQEMESHHVMQAMKVHIKDRIFPNHVVHMNHVETQIVHVIQEKIVGIINNIIKRIIPLFFFSTSA